MQLYPHSHYDDQSNGYSLIKTVPLASAIGAEIQGLNVSTMSDAQFSQVKAALYHYKMIYFRDQNLTIEDQERLTLRFGAFGTDAYTKGMLGHPNVQHVLKEASTKVDRVFGEGWHTDSPFLPQPPAISLLYARHVPPYGGDTWWANCELAYEFLSDGMKAMLQGLRVHMTAREAIRLTIKKDEQGKEIVGDMKMVMNNEAEIIKGNFHPLVRTHPETGKKALYVDPLYAQGIMGMKDEEAKPLLNYLASHIARDDFTCRLRWSAGTLVLWDNRICQHKAFNDYDGHKREMIRTMVNGEVPA
jgi:taurine dioxygenase